MSKELSPENDLPTCLGHLLLACVAGSGFRNVVRSYFHPGMHGVLTAHGITGVFFYAKDALKIDVSKIYPITLKAATFLPLPCLMAEMYRIPNQTFSLLHLASGVIPFLAAASGVDNPQLGPLVAAGNIISLLYYSYKYDRQWGYYTAGVAAIAYFSAPVKEAKMILPFALAGMNYCAQVFYTGFASI